MRIRLFWIGKTKENYLNEGINRYLKLINQMAQISVIEIKEKKPYRKEDNLLSETKEILRQTNSFFLLDEKGKEYTSVELAELLRDKSSIDFVLGGPFGVSDEIKKRAIAAISLSKMTFTHEMARLIFLEQIYRAINIIKGTGYHH